MTTADTEYIKSGGAQVALTCLEKCVCVCVCYVYVFESYHTPGWVLSPAAILFHYTRACKRMQTEGKHLCVRSNHITLLSVEALRNTLQSHPPDGDLGLRCVSTTALSEVVGGVEYMSSERPKSATLTVPLMSSLQHRAQ